MSEKQCNDKDLPIQVKKDGRKGGNRKKRTQAQFIEISRNIHNNFYSYEKAVYCGSTKRVTITCPIHGDFEQVATNHMRGYGCLLCGIDRNKLTKESFIKRANEKFKSKYDYSLVSFGLSTDKITIVCPEHGKFYQTPTGHLNGTGCKKCNGKVWTNKRFAKTASEIHQNKYDYSLADLESRGKKNEKVVIICPTHGEFKQAVGEHLNGSGCLQCAKELAGWRKSDFVRKCNQDGGSNAILYVIDCEKDEEKFFKIGITSKSVEHRFKIQRHFPYNYRSIYEVVGMPEFIYDLEHRLHGILKEYRYKPSRNFRGYTECFSDIKPIEPLLKTLQKTDQLQLIA